MGSQGAQLEEALSRQAQEAGIALLGPNCLGLINTDPALSMNASFARSMAQPGNIAFISQSGALCTSILDYARANLIGFSKFISFGNKSDVDELDLLQYLAGDPQTEVILMYIEELSEGQRFIHLARQITAEQGQHNKPILAIKTGRTPEGASAAASHTGSLAGTDEVYDTIMSQAGVLRVDTVQELFGYAVAFASQPMPKGARVAIVTNAGGPGIMTTDACVRQGLQLARFGEETRARMAASLPPEASLKNPIDLIGDARSERYAAALQAVLEDEDTDSALVILTPQTMTDIEEVARVVARFSQRRVKPVLASFMGGLDVAAGVEILRQGGVPHYPFPEEGARVLRAMWQYSQWRERPRTEERIFSVDRARANSLLSGALGQGRRQLSESEALEVLEAYGFPVPRRGLARSRGEVEAVCAAVGFPVVMKIASPDILHKTDVGGVAVLEELESDFQSHGGVGVHFRPIEPTDEPLLQELFYRSSEKTIYLRFFSHLKAMPHRRAQQFVAIDYQRHLALVGMVPEGERQVIIAVGRYHLDPATNWADCAFMVRDDWQDKGVGSYLVGRLIEIARHRGIEGMSADVLVENTRMMHVFHLCAPGPIQSRFEEGAYHISFALEPGQSPTS
ncbi:MAG: GNAT family N-acetyltransferase [Candidatus Latescibacteria bacterium]|nr:GNAT family N-acetyltransferase [Candidatus Latescibacterota bacterium]